MKTRYLLPLLGYVLVIFLLVTSCSTATTTSNSVKPTSSAQVSATSTTVPTTTTAATDKPQGELVAALPSFGNENFLPWKEDAASSQIGILVYDVLIYWDEVNRKFIPGLAESWEISPDATNLTYHLRKSVQFQDGWGEMTSGDVKYNFEKQAAPDSVGKTSQARSVASMDTPDPYTLVIHFKTPKPSFFSEFSLGNGGVCQGIVSKKYVETVGETIASQKPIGTGPYKLIESKGSSYYKLQSLDSHWRVISEFKTIILRNIPEVSALVAALKTKEIDLATIPAEQMSDLKAAGLAIEVSPAGGVLEASFGGICLSADSRYDPAYHNKDPWIDVRIRKAMTISIDREAICEAIFFGGATPAGAPIYTPNIDKYQYPYDPAAARQLLTEAGYPNGFSFKVISFAVSGVPESVRVMETLAAYWQQIGLDPKITVSDVAAVNTLRTQLKTAGQITPFRQTQVADMLDRVSMQLMPGGASSYFQDEESYAIYQEANAKVNPEERTAYVDKLNQYYFEHIGPVPIVTISNTYAWNSAKISPFPHSSLTPYYLEYVRHAQPLNTFRLFTPWPGR